MEGSVRRRRSSAAQQQQQQRGKESAIGGATRGKVAGKQSQGKSAVAVVPPSKQLLRKTNNSNSNNNSSNNNRRVSHEPPPLTSRIAFGRTCSARPLGHATPTRQPHSSQQRPLAAAHERLELLLTRIEQGSEASITTTSTSTPTATATSTSAPRRRRPATTRAVRRQMEHPPPVPTVTPQSSARNSNYEQLLQTATTTTVATTTPTATTTTVATSGDLATTATFVPLTQNPHLLLPGQRRALIELLSRAEKHDQEIVNILHAELRDAGDPSKDAMRLTLLMLPLVLKPGDSPYRKRFLAGHRYLKERQKLHQQLQPDDMRYKEVKILRAPDGKFFLSKTLEEELKDEKHVLDFIESELQRSQQTSMTSGQRALEEQVLEERRELDRQKQQVSEWRARHHLQEVKRAEKQVTKKMLEKTKKKMPKQIEYKNELTIIEEVEKEEENQEPDQDADGDVTLRPTAAQATMPEDLKDVLTQRQQFREQCASSSLYNDAKCATPWKLFANVANKLSAELVTKAEDELYRSMAGYLKDFVDNEARITKQTQ